MSIITKLEVCKKNKDRVNIYVDDMFFTSAFLEVVYLNKLKVDQEIDEKHLNEIILKDEIQKAESYAIKLLSKFLKTEFEVKKKLKERGYSDSITKQVIDKLKNYGYVNDESFSNNYKSFNEQSKSEYVIKQQLKLKGISDNIISNLSFDKNCEFLSAQKNANKWIKNKEHTKENMFKLSNFLYGKGFKSETIKKVINQLSENEIEWE